MIKLECRLFEVNSFNSFIVFLSVIRPNCSLWHKMVDVSDQSEPRGAAAHADSWTDEARIYNLHPVNKDTFFFPHIKIIISHPTFDLNPFKFSRWRTETELTWRPAGKVSLTNTDVQIKE